jgi:hypothetical protein
MKLIFASLALVFIISAIFPMSIAYAKEAVVTPTPLSPTGTITDKTPTFSWSKITGATKYEFSVYKGTSSTALYTKTITSPNCDSTKCSNTPVTVLALASYKWKIRAYVSGSWKTPSALKSFIVSPPGFNSQFNGDMTGWAKKSGEAWTVTATAMQTLGTPLSNTVYKTGSQYTNFDYSARVKMIGGTYDDGTTTWLPGAYLHFRMGSDVDPLNNGWFPGYSFGYIDCQWFRIAKVDSTGAETILQDFTYSEFIVNNDWNILRVVANNSTMKFYINSHLVATITDTMRKSGYVGIGYFKFEGAEPGSILVDWAKLTLPTSSSN